MTENDLIAFLTVILSGGFVTTVWIVSRAWVKRSVGSGTKEEQEKLAAAVNSLRHEVDSLKGEMDAQVGELHERLDFAERLLTKGDQSGTS